MSPRGLVIGNLDNRRITGFVDALARRGQPPPLLLSHAQLIEAPERLAALPDEPLWVRIDAAGEDPRVERALLRLGWSSARGRGCERISPERLAALPHRHGQILAPRQHHLGFLRHLERLAAVFRERPRWRVLNPVEDLRILFDKRLSSRLYAELDIPVPPPLAPEDPPATPDELRAAMVAHGWPAVFVKVSCASSASCLALYRHLPGARPDRRELALTTVARRPEGRFNSLRVQRLDRREEIDELLSWLLAEGAQIERAIPKARLRGRSFDLRVLMIAGEPAFWVVRRSLHPITNLHLGGQRGDPEAVRERVSPRAWAAAMASCARVHAAHGCLHVGVDLLFEADFARHRVIEANAFGDLLPGLQREGLEVYEWEIEAMLGRLHSTPSSSQTRSRNTPTE